MTSTDCTRSSPMSLRGAGFYGAGGSVISYNGSGTFLTCNTTGQGLLLEDFRIAGTSAMQNGVFLNSINNQINLNRLAIEGDNSGHGNALQLQDVFDVDITGGTYRYCDIGIKANNSGTNKTINNMNIRDNDLQNNNTGVFWQTGFGGNIDGNDFSGCGICIDLGNGIAATQALEAVNIGQNYCEATTYARIGYNANANTNVRAINIHGGYLECTGDYIHLYVCNRVSITGVRFGSLNSGKKHIIIESTAQHTYINLPELDPANVTDNSSTTIYAPHLIGQVNAHLATTQSVAYNTEVNVAFDTVDFDKYGEWDSTNHGWRCKRKSATGFRIFGNAQFVNMNVGESVSGEIAINGTRFKSNDDYATGAYPSVPCFYDSAPGDINVGDLVTFRVVHKHLSGGSPASANVNTGTNCTYFSVSAR